MDFKTQLATAAGLSTVPADALLVVILGQSVPAELDATLAAAATAAVDAGDLVFKPGTVLYAHRVAGVKASRVLFVAAGDGSVKNFRKAVAAGFGAIKGGGASRVVVAVAGAGADALGQAHGEALVSAVNDALYVYRATKPSAPALAKVSGVSLVCSKTQSAAVARGLRIGEAIAAGVELARECANLPANHCTPTYLAHEAKRLGKAHGLKVEVLDRKDVEKLGMGSFLAVAQGSHEPLKFIVARWQGAPKTVAPVVLVGKGITFDTGGISLKPGAKMDEMKYDMGGAASVLGTLHAIATLEAQVNLIGIIPACENMPSSRAVKPGDVVTSMSGQTIEILNTDAEGRLILCDALTYAERFDAAAVIDIATPTGACITALGHHRSGLFSPDDSLAAELHAAGEAAGDPAWRMPLDAEYDESLKSNFADVANIGDGTAGAVLGAMFLKRFAAKLRWAHLDIAGTAWRSGAAKGATGRPVPLLTHYVLAQEKTAPPKSVA